MIKKTAYFFLTMLIAVTQFSCKHEIPVNPGVVDPADTTGTNGVCFESDVLPIFIGNCAVTTCHDAEGSHEAEDYRLDTYSNIILRGIIPGNAGNSKIYKVLVENGGERMPQGRNPLTPAQINLIATWINAGARNTANCSSSCDSSRFTYNANVKPILQTHCYGCHSGAAASGGYVPLDTYDGVREQALFGALYVSIDHAPGANPMPQNGSKLIDCKIAVIRQWIEAGAPDN